MRHQKKRNRSVKVKEYVLSITTGGTVYWDSLRGKRKLDAMFFKGELHVSLPDDTTVIIIQNVKGELKVKGEPEEEKPEEVKPKEVKA